MFFVRHLCLKSPALSLCSKIARNDSRLIGLGEGTEVYYDRTEKRLSGRKCNPRVSHLTNAISTMHLLYTYITAGSNSQSALLNSRTSTFVSRPTHPHSRLSCLLLSFLSARHIAPTPSQRPLANSPFPRSHPQVP
jgi:hypothetical protein